MIPIDSNSPQARFHTESRKYRIFLFYLVQSIAGVISQFILRATQTFFVFQLEQEDAKYISESLRVDYRDIIELQRQEYIALRKRVRHFPVHARTLDHEPIQIDTKEFAEFISKVDVYMESQKAELYNGVVEEPQADEPAHLEEATKSKKQKTESSSDKQWVPWPNHEIILKIIGMNFPVELKDLRIMAKSEGCEGDVDKLLDDLENYQWLRKTKLIQVRKGARPYYYCLTDKAKKRYRTRPFKSGEEHEVMDFNCNIHLNKVFLGKEYQTVKEYHIGDKMTVDRVVLENGKPLLALEYGSPFTKPEHEYENILKCLEAEPPFQKIFSIGADSEIRDAIKKLVDAHMSKEQKIRVEVVTCSHFTSLKKEQLF